MGLRRGQGLAYGFGLLWTADDAAGAEGGAGEEVKCNDNTECDDVNPCTVDSCVTGKCQWAALADGVALVDTMPGDCVTPVCKGGVVTLVPDDADPPEDLDLNDCTVPACTNGESLIVSAPAGAACSITGGEKCCGSTCCPDTAMGGVGYCDMNFMCCASGRTCGGTCCSTSHGCQGMSCCPSAAMCADGTCCPAGGYCEMNQCYVIVP